MLVEASGPPVDDTGVILVTSALKPMPSEDKPPRFSSKRTLVPFGLIKVRVKSEIRGWSIRTPTSMDSTRSAFVRSRLAYEIASSTIGVFCEEVKRSRLGRLGAIASETDRFRLAGTDPELHKRDTYSPGLTGGRLVASMVVEALIGASVSKRLG